MDCEGLLSVFDVLRIVQHLLLHIDGGVVAPHWFTGPIQNTSKTANAGTSARAEELVGGRLAD